jgi:hypothetical protein
MFANAQTTRLEWTILIRYVLHSLIRLMFHSGAPRVPATSSLDQAISRAHADTTIKILIAQGIDINARNIHGDFTRQLRKRSLFFKSQEGFDIEIHLTSLVGFIADFIVAGIFGNSRPYPRNRRQNPATRSRGQS